MNMSLETEFLLEIQSVTLILISFLPSGQLQFNFFFYLRELFLNIFGLLFSLFLTLLTLASSPATFTYCLWPYSYWIRILIEVIKAFNFLFFDAVDLLNIDVESEFFQILISILSIPKYIVLIPIR